MGKGNFQTNKQHRRKKDKRKHKENSKQEYFKQKKLRQSQQKQLKKEAERYEISDFTKQKIRQILNELKQHNEDTLAELPEIFEMLDQKNDIDVTDIEDGFVKEKLERLLDLIPGYIIRVEDDEGVFVYRKSGDKSIKSLMDKYLHNISKPQNIEIVKGPTMPPQEFLPQVSLLQMHQETHKVTSSSKYDKYVYGNKTLDKRFNSGKFTRSFL